MQNLLSGKLKPDGSWRKEDEFNKAEKFGKVPKGWTLRKMKDIGKFYGGSTPSTNEPSYWNGTINWLVPSDISSLPSSQKFLKETSQKITIKGFKSCSTVLLPPGTLCLSSRATIGDCIIAENEICTNQGFINIVFSEEKIALNLFILYWIRQNKNTILKFAAGTTFGEIGRGTFKKLHIALPPFDEQVVIVNKIDKVDSILFSKQIKVIKLERLKKALMQNLLTGKVGLKVT
jgi:type I restriction enzyme S subunit